MKKLLRRSYLLTRFVYHLRGQKSTEELVRQGMRVGRNFYRGYNVSLDDLCWLIDIGDNVTLAAGVCILCHDAGTKRFLGYSRVGRVSIGDNVFIGAGSVVLPGVSIGSNVIIGAGSTVTRDIPGGAVAMGCPARVCGTLEDYLQKQRRRMERSGCYGAEYTLRGGVTPARKQELRDALAHGEVAFID